VRLDFGDASQESLGEAKIPRPRVVGVFVDQTAEEIASVASEVGLDAVQLSGECSPTACRSAFEATGLPVIAVMRLGGSVDATTAWAQELAETQGVAAVLVDAPGTVGGAGHPWDHSQARRIVQSTAVVGVPVIVAGGLHAGNVAGALVSTGAWGADVASGVETDGMTDPTRVRAFIAAARGSNRNETAPTAHKP
jgi:phosphoribosylanthranilate isomerase